MHGRRVSTLTDAVLSMKAVLFAKSVFKQLHFVGLHRGRETLTLTLPLQTWLKGAQLGHYVPDTSCS